MFGDMFQRCENMEELDMMVNRIESALMSEYQDREDELRGEDTDEEDN